MSNKQRKVVVHCVRKDSAGHVIAQKERDFPTRKKAQIFCDAMLTAGYLVSLKEGADD